jgi:2-polyprenyl-3-methyl-5-hydroxy-6-metoxy-1,4-benzoquinol methylase
VNLFSHWAAISERRQATFSHKSRFGKLLGPLAPLALENYSEHHVWNVLLPRYLKTKGKLLEVGCAPGRYLISLNRQFGLEPYGVDYEQTGVDETRRNFERAKLDTSNIIHADFFSPQFQKKYRESFDVVFSNGFIEHFPNPKEVVRLHSDLVKPGGQLIVMIPALRGINYLIERLVNIDVLRIHNTEIMTRKTFAELFPQGEYCGHYGSFDWHLFYAPQGTLRQRVLGVFDRTQPVINLLSRLILRDRALPILKNVFCPGLIYIGRKTSWTAARPL